MNWKKRICFGFFYCVPVVLMIMQPAFPAQQKYKRRYQKKEAVYQKKKSPYFQKKDLPFSGAYIEVSRKMPKVSVDYRPERTSFVVGRERVPCRGDETLSCTSFGADFFVETDCDNSRLTLKVVENPEMTVELSSLYPKGSRRFDMMLKHELAHEKAYRKALEDFIGEASGKLEEAYVAGQRGSDRCKNIKQKIDGLTAGFSGQYSERAQAENLSLDFENGAHKYGFEACMPPETTGVLK